MRGSPEARLEHAACAGGRTPRIAGIASRKINPSAIRDSRKPMKATRATTPTNNPPPPPPTTPPPPIGEPPPSLSSARPLYSVYQLLLLSANRKPPRRLAFASSLRLRSLYFGDEKECRPAQPRGENQKKDNKKTKKKKDRRGPQMAFDLRLETRPARIGRAASRLGRIRATAGAFRIAVAQASAGGHQCSAISRRK